MRAKRGFIEDFDRVAAHHINRYDRKRDVSKVGDVECISIDITRYINTNYTITLRLDSGFKFYYLAYIMQRVARRLFCEGLIT